MHPTHESAFENQCSQLGTMNSALQGQHKIFQQVDDIDQAHVEYALTVEVAFIRLDCFSGSFRWRGPSNLCWYYIKYSFNSSSVFSGIKQLSALVLHHLLLWKIDVFQVSPGSSNIKLNMVRYIHHFVFKVSFWYPLYHRNIWINFLYTLENQGLMLTIF